MEFIILKTLPNWNSIAYISRMPGINCLEFNKNGLFNISPTVLWFKKLLIREKLYYCILLFKQKIEKEESISLNGVYRSTKPAHSDILFLKNNGHSCIYILLSPSVRVSQ